MGGYQNDGPLWGPLGSRCRIIFRTAKLRSCRAVLSILGYWAIVLGSFGGPGRF